LSQSNAQKKPKAAPQDLLDAAAACFTEKGYAGTSLDDVARHMGATKGRIYHYFASKSELMHAVRKRGMDINFAAIRPAFNSNLPPLAKFRAMAKAHALNMIEEQAYQKALFDNLHLHITRGTKPDNDDLMDDFIAERRQFENMFREVLIAGQEHGVFDIKTVSYALHTVVTTLNSTIYWYSPRPDETATDRQEIAVELVDMATRALGAQTNTKTKE
jgi:AcrR family transcriptional regulator